MSDDVLTYTEGRAGRIRLNRPKAIHALNTAMCAAILDALDAWERDPAVEIVLIDHAEGRGFCAGGDIRMLAESGAKDGIEARAFFHTEYQMNHRLFTYPKPTVAFMDGITMGGGVGISLPCRYRVATEHTRFAMPETGIGLFPDVGGGWHLSRLPGRTGLWLALTGARLTAADCLEIGIANATVLSTALPLLRADLLHDPQAVQSVLSLHTSNLGHPGLIDWQREIDETFQGEGVEAIIAALARHNSSWARRQLEILATKSPQTMKVAFRQLQLGAKARTFTENMVTEYRIGARVVQRHDFLEGVRAVIVEKDNTPKWNPSRLDDVDNALLEGIFAPLPPAEEWTPLEGATA